MLHFVIKQGRTDKFPNFIDDVRNCQHQRQGQRSTDMSKELGSHIDIDNLYGKIVREIQDSSTHLFQPLIYKKITGSRSQNILVENIRHCHKGKYRNHHQYYCNTY